MDQPLAAEHRSFSTLLSALEEGRVHADATNAVQEIVAELHNLRVDNGGKPKGKLVITLDFEFDGELFGVAGEVTVKLPKRARRRAMLYATEDNNLTARNPKQRELGLKTVNRDQTETRTA